MLKVLIVENNPVFQKLLAHFFEIEKSTTMTATDGLAAMNLLDTFQPDIIVTDIIMPKISGDQLCKIIRNTGKFKDVYLVVMSSIFVEDETLIRELDADLYYAKGTKTTLHKCIIDILKNFKNGIRRSLSIVHTENLNPRSITQELLFDRNHYETFFHSLSEAIVELNTNGQIIQANAAAARILNQDVSAILSHSLLNYISGPPFSEVKSWLNAIEKKSPQTFTSSYDEPLKADGKSVLVHLMSTAIKEEIYISCAIQDITERKKTEKELKQAHLNLQDKNREIESINRLLSSTISEYELIFDNGHLGIMIFEDGNILSRCNQRFANILGFNSPEELIGKRLCDLLLSEEEGKAFEKRCKSQLQNNTMKRIEIQLLRMDDSSIWCLISGRAKDISSPADLSKGIVWIVEDISHRKLIQEKIKHQAYYDSLTGLPNRRLLHTILAKEISRARRHGQTGALLFIDLDNFKTINDSLGHSAGDELLKLVAERITDNLRKEDTASRMGGDEFVILLPDLDDDIKNAANKSQDAAKKLCDLFSLPFQVNMHDIHITISTGVSLFPSKRKTVEDVLKQADAAMYRAKSEGRNTFRFFLPSMQKAANERLLLNTDLKKAIKNNELHVVFQPQVNINRDIIGAEALLRWNHPTRGFISPGEFIPIAEETGLIRDIGYWVLKTTCKSIKKWDDAKFLQKNQTISVNFSPKEFAAPDFVERIISTLGSTGTDPTYLSIELTESSLVYSIKETIKKIKKLREIGIKFSIDDFGTGYSSLSHLQKLPLNTLKIDRSFIADIGNPNSEAIIVETIIMMAKNLGLEVIAEGVETKEEVAYLRSRGCLNYQGYYFSKPLEEEKFYNLLQKKVCA